MAASVPRDPFAMAAGRIDPDGTAATRLVPTRLRLVATTPPPDLLPAAPASDAEQSDGEQPDAEQPDAEPDPERPFRPLTRDLTHRHSAPEARAPHHDHLVPHFSRLAHSAVTFGPVGRVVLTLLLLALPVFLLWVSLVWIVFDGIYLFFLVPALRDVWQPVRVPPPAPSDAPEPVESGESGETSLSGR